MQFLKKLVEFAVALVGFMAIAAVSGLVVSVVVGVYY